MGSIHWKTHTLVEGDLFSFPLPSLLLPFLSYFHHGHLSLPSLLHSSFTSALLFPFLLFPCSLLVHSPSPLLVSPLLHINPSSHPGFPPVASSTPLHLSTCLLFSTSSHFTHHPLLHPPGLDVSGLRQAALIAGQSSTRRIGDYRVKYNYTDIDLLR